MTCAWKRIDCCALDPLVVLHFKWNVEHGPVFIVYHSSISHKDFSKMVIKENYLVFNRWFELCHLQKTEGSRQAWHKTEIWEEKARYSVTVLSRLDPQRQGIEFRVFDVVFELRNPRRVPENLHVSSVLDYHSFWNVDIERLCVTASARERAGERGRTN